MVGIDTHARLSVTGIMQLMCIELSSQLAGYTFQLSKHSICKKLRKTTAKLLVIESFFNDALLVWIVQMSKEMTCCPFYVLDSVSVSFLFLVLSLHSKEVPEYIMQ